MAEKVAVVFRYTPGGPTGSGAQGKVRIIAGEIDPALFTPADILEAIRQLNQIKASADHLVAVANAPAVVEKLGYKPFASFGWYVEPKDTPA